jgi:uncharacterized membrane protein
MIGAQAPLKGDQLAAWWAVIPSDAPAVYGVVNKYLLPLAVPLLLFSADLRQGQRSCRPLPASTQH